MMLLRFVASALCLIHLAACLPVGQRLCSLEILHGERVVLETNFDVSDSEGIAGIWDEAGEVPFATPVVHLTPAPGEPNLVHLSGPVTVRISHGQEVLTEVPLDGLELVRSGDGDEDWRLPPAEIQRAKRAAGF